MSSHRWSLGRLVASGLVLVLPVLLVGVVLEALYGILAGWLSPLLDSMPGIVFEHKVSRFIGVMVLLVLLALLVGALANTRPGRAAGRRLELALLRRVPFYHALRIWVVTLTGRESGEAMKAVLVTVDEPGLQQLGVRINTLADGRSTILLPGSPNPGSGTLVIVVPERVQELTVSVRDVLGCLARWGQGSEAILAPRGDRAASGDAPRPGDDVSEH